MMNGEGDLVVGNFVLANTTSFNITRHGISKSKWSKISKKRERGYCRSLQHGPIAPRITSIPCTSSKICPIKDHYPMAFSDS